jgi:hypothetical protein
LQLPLTWKNPSFEHLSVEEADVVAPDVLGVDDIAVSAVVSEGCCVLLPIAAVVSWLL